MNIEAIDHLSLTVTDPERSSYFYRNILGFELKQVPPDYPNKLNAGAYYFSVGGVEITLLRHEQTPENDKFNEFRVGLDHISFRVKSQAELEKVIMFLNKNGVENDGIQTYEPNGKKYVVVRDPDNIQLEFWLDQPE
jgi:catechol 2,3-dioxygenase-like lactoylglutathione lyase family enzyme